LKLKAKFFLENYIGLLCSSHSNNSRSVEFRFKYAPHTGKNFTASCHANHTGIIHYNNNHWLIYRMKVAPYDCILAIQNNTYDYDGDYECVGRFFIDGKIVKVSSNHIGLSEEENVSPIPPLKPSGRGKGGEIYLSIPIAIVLMLLLLAATCIWKKRRDRTPDHAPAIQESSQPNGDAAIVYGAIAGAAALLANNAVGQRDTSKGSITISC